MTYDVHALRREEFPWADQRIYLNHASLGPLPARTLRAINDFNTRRAVPFQVVGDDFLTIPAEARAAAARLINADPDEIGLVQTTSLGLNLAAHALPFVEGDLILVSDKEFPSNIYPWKLLKERGVGVEIVSCTPEGWPDEERLIRRLAKPRVRAIAVSAIQFATGYRVDLARLSAETRKRHKLLIVDAIQGVGCYPIDVRKTPVDILTAAAQKWMLGPWGAGFIYARRELWPTLTPTVANWLGYAGSDDVTQLTSYHDRHHPNARRFEISGHALQDLIGLTTSAGLLAELGPAAIVEHVRRIHEPVLAAAQKQGIAVASPTDAARPCTLSLRPADPAALHAKLERAGVHCSLREGLVRLSPHCYNTLAEMERVAALL
jgi:cysteine desulfurase / selenocysteine lyase